MINRQIDQNVSENVNLSTVVLDWETDLLQNIAPNTALEDRASSYRLQFNKDIWNVTSELLFAGYSGLSGFDIVFVPRLNRQDFDFVVAGFPIQVKSLNTPELVSSMAIAKQHRKDKVESNEITYELALEMVLKAVRYKITELDDGLAQGAKIIIMNGTSDKSGQYFSQYCFESDNPYPFKRSLVSSIDLVKTGESYFPLMYCSTGFRSVYLLNAITLKVPILTIDGQKKIARNEAIEVMSA